MNGPCTCGSAQTCNVLQVGLTGMYEPWNPWFCPMDQPSGRDHLDCVSAGSGSVRTVLQRAYLSGVSTVSLWIA
jgi:hypothetical protein